MGGDWIARTSEGALVHVRVSPRGSRTAIEGLHGDRLKVKVAAPPADGAANDAVAKLLARVAGTPRSSVALVRGGRSREKTYFVDGVAVDELRGRIAQELP